VVDSDSAAADYVNAVFDLPVPSNEHAFCVDVVKALP